MTHVLVVLTACEQDQDGTGFPSWSCSQAVSTPVWHIPLLCVQWNTPDDGQRNCPKYVEFYFKTKFEKLVHLVGFTIRIYHDPRSRERQIYLCVARARVCFLNVAVLMYRVTVRRWDNILSTKEQKFHI